MKEYTIRRVELGDEDALAFIQTESWKSAFGSILSRETLEECTNIEKARKMYHSLLEAQVANGYLLEVEGKPHCIAYWDQTREKNMPGYAELICIHSLAGNWGKGYGSKMMQQVLTDMEKAGYDKVMLWVFEENYRARKFYEGFGFHKTDRAQDAFGATEIMYMKD